MRMEGRGGRRGQEVAREYDIVCFYIIRGSTIT